MIRRIGTARTPLGSLLLMMGLLLVLPACTQGYHADARLLSLVSRAEFGRARGMLTTQTPTPAHHRDDLLMLTKQGMLAMADGVPDAADRFYEPVFDILRTQGLNDDRTTDSIFVSEEGVRIWKGEPFEQALTFAAMAENDAMRSDWGNMRASILNAMFHLRDYSKVPDVHVNNPDETIGYVPVETNFALGYLLEAIAELELHRMADAGDALAAALAIDPTLEPVVETLQRGQYDTILIVDAGLGPRREAVGNAGTAIAYVPRSPSDSAPLRVTIGNTADADDPNAPIWHWPVACDVNEMALDMRWQSLQSIRQFKAGLGQAMQLGGLILASTGDTRGGDDDLARLGAGLSLVALGAIAENNARADTRHNELLPQRVYIAPITLGQHTGPVHVSVLNHPAWHMTLFGLDHRKPGEHLVRYVRLPTREVNWAQARGILYGNDITGPIDHPTLPFLLGGLDGRTLDGPYAQTIMHEYELAGLPVDISPEDLQELYRKEGITQYPLDDQRFVTGHIFEGGHSLYTPLAGTTGFTRLVAHRHRPYEPHSSALINLRQRIAQVRQNDAHAATTITTENTTNKEISP